MSMSKHGELCVSIYFFACILMMMLGLALAFWREDVRTFGIMLVLLSALPLIGSAIFEFIKARMKF